MKKNIFNKTCVALDIETTDLSPEKGSIIELAAVKFKGGKIISKYQSLIDPEVNIPKMVEAITGISDKDVAASPKINEVIEEFNKFVGNYPIVGHNISFDINFLNQKGFAFKNPWYDTWKLAVLLVPNLTSHSLESLSSFFNIKHIESHRALDDVLASIDLFNILISKIYELDIEILKDVKQTIQKTNWELKDILNYIYSQKPKTKEEAAVRKDKIISDKEKIKNNIEKIDKIFEDRQKIAKSFKKYQYRSEQVKLMQELLSSIENKQDSFLTIVPGVGKELAYVAASIYYSKNYQQNVFISVENYQKIEEILLEQLEKLNKIFPFDFKHSIMLPRSSYLCLRRLYHLKEHQELTGQDIGTLVKILLWEPTTNTGIFEETARLYEDKTIEDSLNCQEQYCLKNKCDYYQDCYFYKARSESKKADIVLGNHDSLFNLFMEKENNISRNIIIDRAFKLEDSYHNYYGEQISHNDINNILKQLQKEIIALLKHSSRGKKGGHIRDLAKKISKESDRLIDKFSLYMGILGIFLDKQEFSFGFKKILIDDNVDNLKGWYHAEKATKNIISRMNGLIIQMNSLVKLLSAHKYLDIKCEFQGIVKDIYHISNKIQKLISRDSNNDKIWLEEYYQQITLNYSPGGIKEAAFDDLMDGVDSLNIINTSYKNDKSDNFAGSSLKLKSKINHIYIDKKDTGDKQMKILVPTDIPNPNDIDFNNISKKIILDIAKKLKNGVVVSASSRSVIKSLYEDLALSLKGSDIKVNAQGVSGGREKVYNQHIHGGNSLLIANHQLLIDKDFPSNSIKCLILLKFPFQMSNIPLSTGNKGNSRSEFTDKVLPSAVFRYMKIYQKVAKNRENKGIFVNLDNRLGSSNYGDDFIKSIPDIDIEYVDMNNIGKNVHDWVKQGM